MLIGQKITVLGAGIAGLAVATALAMRGAQVTVLERADALREVGAGLQISPNGARVLVALGLGAALAQQGVAAQAVVLRDGLRGKQVLRLDLAGLGPGRGYHFLHRADLIEMLAQAARDAGVRFRMLQQVTELTLGDHMPRLRTAQGAECDLPLVIGADGLHSVVRQALNGKVAPFFTHQVAWRAVIPETPGAPAEAQVFMGPGRHLVSYPLRGGTQRNIVAVEERRSWTEEGWTHEDNPENLRAAFAAFGGPLPDWLAQVGQVHLWGLFRHPVAQHWYRVNGADQGVAILGDAAHPTLPFMAQGANMALEDAWVLADCLASHDGLAAAFAAYQMRRQSRVRAVVEAANRNARAYHLRGPLRGVAHLGLRIGGRLMPDAPLRRFDWIYGHDVTAAATG
ncbi:FAD-dependent monooxygenase [Plastorhodobacter daqingensis]|uniref:FAD-dependent monooxygenase n=1 Tax=Plastorhodobacter daqingensis TaxID=1387281 RepID=A0ABW2UJM0_9RHOB